MDRSIWASFLVSRGLVAFSAICLSQVVTRAEYVVPLPPIQDWPRLLHAVLFVADSGFYLWITEAGYQPGPFRADVQANWPFFPLYPLLVDALSWVVPLSQRWIGILVSNLALFGSLVLLYRVVSSDWGQATARNALWLLALFPVSYFLSGFRPEAVFLFLTLLTYQQARSQRWWIAGLAGGLAAATRPQGVLVALLLLVEGFRQYGWQWRPLLPVAGSVVLTVSGLAAFMLYLWSHTGNPLAFVHVQAAWHQDPVPLGWPLLAYLRSPYLVSHGGWDLGIVNVPLLLIGLAAGVWLFKLKHPAPAAYLLASLVVPLTTDTLQGSARYLAATFPVYLGLASWLDRQAGEWRQAVLAVSAGLLTVLSLLVALDIHAAQA